MKYYILTIGKSKLYYIKVLDISQEILNFENLVKLLNHFMILNEVKEITLAEYQQCEKNIEEWNNHLLGMSKINTSDQFTCNHECFECPLSGRCISKRN